MDNKKILIVEDDDDVLRALGVWLKGHGFDTVYAQDGASAVAAAVREQPDLVVLDIGLPAGDGWTVMERVRAKPEFSTTPFVVVSARDPVEIATDGRKKGANAFLEKPVDGKELLSIANELLSRP